MIASVFYRRRAERLARLIDRIGAARRHHVKPGVDVRCGVDHDLADLVTVSRRLADLPVKMEANPEFRDSLRAMLLATIEREGIGATAKPDLAATRWRLAGGSLRHTAAVRPPLTRRARTWGAIVIGLAAGTLAISAMSAVSGDAIPGDPLYSVKRSTERAQIALAGSDISRGQLYLEFARTRLDEAAAVRADPAGLTGVLDDMDAETRQGVRLLTTTAVERKDGAALDAIDAFVTAQRDAILRLRDSVAGGARSRADASLRLLDEVVYRSKALRQVLKCANAAAAALDALGPQATSPCKPTGERSSGPTGQPTGPNANGGPAAVPSVSPLGPTGPAPSVQASTPQPTSSPSASPSSSIGLFGGPNDIVGG